VYSLGLVLYELFEKQLPPYDQMRQMVVLPPSFQSASVVIPCLSVVPEQRPTCAQVVKVLDKMIMNIVSTVKTQLTPEEQEKLRQAAGITEQDDDSLDIELQQLYQHLLHRPAMEVDALINKGFHISASVSQPKPAHQQIPYGMPAVGGPIQGLGGIPGVHGISGIQPGMQPGMVGLPMGGMPVSGVPMQGYPPTYY